MARKRKKTKKRTARKRIIRKEKVFHGRTEKEWEEWGEQFGKEWQREAKYGKIPPGLSSRIAFSIIVFILWISFIVVWLAFYAVGFNVYQNIAILVVSILITFAVLGISWVTWSMKMAKEPIRKKKR